MTLLEAEYLYTASDKVKELAASGELQQLHKRCDTVEKDVDTAYIKSMDLLTRTELQINQAENELYEELQSNHEELSEIRLHGQSLSDRDA